MGALLAFALSGMTGLAAAAGLVPGAGEIVREGTLLDGPCSMTPPPARNVQNWGPEKNGTPYIGMEVYTRFYELDSHGQVKGDWVGQVKPPPPIQDLPGCIYNDGDPIHGIKAIDRGIWLMRVHHVRINREYESTQQLGWVPAAGDGTDAVTEIRFEVVGPNTCGNSAWVGLGPTDPACLRDNEKKQAADVAKREQQELPLRNADYRNMCGIGKLNAATDYKSGKAGACIGYFLSIESEASEMRTNQRIAHDPPNPDYMTVTTPHPPAQSGLARLPAQWTAYRAVLNDMDWVIADLQAMVTAIERANGAYAATARNPAADAWTQRQNQARYKAIDDAVDRIGDAENKLSDAQNELLAAGLPQTTVDKLIGMETQRVNRMDALVELLR